MESTTTIKELIPRFRIFSMVNGNSILKQTYFQHTVFWLLYFSFNVFRWGIYFNDFEYSFQSNLVEFSMHIIIVYFNFNVLLPKLFPTKIWKYILALVLSLVAISSIRILLTYQLVTTEIYKEASIRSFKLFDPNYFIAVFVGELYVVGFTSAIKLGMEYVSSINKTKDLETKKLEAELSFLRSQIQPHFFFNTLNNLYSLTLTQSKRAPETVLKLSELMSYVIYEGKSKRVELHKEIKHIQDYLDLENLRYSNRLETNIEIHGSIEDLYVPPLMLTPFIENCFKHGNTDADKIPIDITINVENNRLNYVVTNELRTKDSSIGKEKREGIGIKNAIRRMDLLFKNDYSLDIHKDKKTFTIHLSMPLYDQKSDS